MTFETFAKCFEEEWHCSLPEALNTYPRFVDRKTNQEGFISPEKFAVSYDVFLRGLSGYYKAYFSIMPRMFVGDGTIRTIVEDSVKNPKFLELVAEQDPVYAAKARVDYLMKRITDDKAEIKILTDNIMEILNQFSDKVKAIEER